MTVRSAVDLQHGSIGQQAYELTDDEKIEKTKIPVTAEQRTQTVGGMLALNRYQIYVLSWIMTLTLRSTDSAIGAPNCTIYQKQ
jgi:hypothetical protein